jgi:predicted Zn-dependent peptidase
VSPTRSPSGPLPTRKGVDEVEPVRTILGETLYASRLPSGLMAYVLPRPGFQKRYATLSVRYGSDDSTFVPPGAQEPVTVPDGIAHFLEHKMFDQPYGDASDRFAAIGASSNAFTNHNSTTYLFSATEGFEEGLDILTDFVLSPHFTPEGVEREKGIIEQEIRMYLDDPSWAVFHHLLEGLFVKHPLRIEVAGRVESIRRITPQDLTLCYESFYRPDNMVFFAVGDVDPQAVETHLLPRFSQPRPGSPARRVVPSEPAQVCRAWTEVRMPVARPLVFLGFKERQVGREGYVRREVATGLLLSALLGPSSALYEELRREGWVDDPLTLFYYGGPEAAASVVGAETSDPRGLVDRVVQGVRAAQRHGVDPAVFERLRRSAMGEVVAVFDAPEALAAAFVEDHMRGFDLSERLEVLQHLTVADLEERLRAHLTDDALAVSVVWPDENGAA